MKKKDRELIYNKYGGRCAYCGVDLERKWQLDHIEPIVRRRKWKPDWWKNKITGKEGFPKECRDRQERNTFYEAHDKINGDWIPDGCERPELDTLENSNPSCHRCNIRKGSSDVETFRNEISLQIERLKRDSSAFRLAFDYGFIKIEDRPVEFYFEKQNDK